MQGIIYKDLDGDGFEDLLLAGNKYSMEVETGRLDAGTGTFLAGNGKGAFTWVNNLQTGFWADKEVRDLALLNSSVGYKVIVANNDDKIQVYEVSQQ